MTHMGMTGAVYGLPPFDLRKEVRMVLQSADKPLTVLWHS